MGCRLHASSPRSSHRPGCRVQRALPAPGGCPMLPRTAHSEAHMDKPDDRNEIDRPVPGTPSNKTWGSDVVAEVLRDLDIPYVALNPGASYRGLHDSLVNHLGNRQPQMLLVLHEEHAVAI